MREAEAFVLCAQATDLRFEFFDAAPRLGLALGSVGFTFQVCPSVERRREICPNRTDERPMIR
jgi:hypothetical protein